MNSELNYIYIYFFKLNAQQGYLKKSVFKWKCKAIQLSTNQSSYYVKAQCALVHLAVAPAVTPLEEGHHAIVPAFHPTI